MNRKLSALIILSLGFVISSCEFPVETGSQTTVSFKINLTSGISKTEGTVFLSKITTPTDLKIICIDATNYSDSTELSYTLAESIFRTESLNPGLDTIQSFYDYVNLLLGKKFYGDFAKDWEINFDLNSDTSKDVSVHSGLNLFLFFLNENNVTTYSGSIVSTIIKNKDNVVEFNLNDTNQSLEGNVRDATNNKPVSGAAIKLFQGSELIGNCISDEFGRYSFYGIADGLYTVETSKTGYIDNSDSINVNPLDRFKNIILSPESENIVFRIVLEWGKTPVDLDAHLKKAGNNISFTDIGRKNSSPFAFLDIDDVNAFGPETITIYRQNNDSCKYYVENFSLIPDIKNSNAVVKLYSGSRLLSRYQIPAAGTGDYWYIFDIDPDGTVVTKNFITPQEP